jgi:hypothetical protein
MTSARIVFFSFFLSFFLFQKVDAQELRSIKLRLIQSDSTPISAATALVFRNDSILIKSYVSNTEGIIEMENLPSIPLKIDLTRVGFNNFTMNIPAVLTKSRNGVIELTQVLEIKTAALKEIVVQAKKPMIEQKIDRTILNVDASPGNTGNSVVEVLEKAPGVSVDKDGNISLKGKQAVLVLIDGRQTYPSLPLQLNKLN